MSAPAPAVEPAHNLPQEPPQETAQESPQELPQDAPSGADDTNSEKKEHGVKGLKHKVTDKKDELTSQPPGGYDDTPFPKVAPGWTVRFVFHQAENLPAADLTTQAADPFIKATLSAPVPKRHKEDPPLVRRTRTIRNTTGPSWDEEWIVSNVPSAGFKLKCRLYDEDYPDHDDRLGNVTFETSRIEEGWSLGPQGQWFDVKKRMGSKRAYLAKAITSALEKGTAMTGRLRLSIEVLGRSEGFGAQMYTVGPGYFFKHYSPMLGRLTGIKVNEDQEDSMDDDKLDKYE